MRHSVLLLAALAVATPAWAQTPADSAASDSLAQRVAEAERAIALLREQLAALEAGATQTASRARFELSGRVLMNGWSNSRRVNNADVPLFARPDTGGLPLHSLGGSLRQTTLAAAVTSLRALGAAFDGDIAVDFFGGQQASTGGRHFPLVRLRTARATLAWTRAELMAGQESPLVADVDPVSVASVGTPGFTAAGNLWLWLPQLRGTVERGPMGGVRLALQGALLSPATGDAVGAFDTEPDAAERARRPVLQARVRARWGTEDERSGEVGVGVHRAWIATAGDSLLDSHAVAATVRVGIASWLELRGEAFDGQALRGLGGGGIGQLLGVGGRPVRTRGGWGQLNVRRGESLVVGAGCGVDDPRDGDVAPTARRRNRACEAHAIARPGGPLLLGLEWRRLTTDYAASAVVNDHVNVAIGFVF